MRIWTNQFKNFNQANKVGVSGRKHYVEFNVSHETILGFNQWLINEEIDGSEFVQDDGLTEQGGLMFVLFLAKVQ